MRPRPRAGESGPWPPIKRGAILRGRIDVTLADGGCAILVCDCRLAVECPEDGVLEQPAELGPIEIAGVSERGVEDARRTFRD